MDLKKRLTLGQNTLQTCEIIDYVDANGDRFKELVEAFVTGPYRITQRAAKPLILCVKKWPYLIEPHLAKLIRILQKHNTNDTVIRNTIRLFQYINLPERHVGKVTELCFNYLKDFKRPVALRVFSMSVLGQIARHHPELGKELRLILEDQLPNAGPAFKSRGRKILQQLAA